MKQIIYGIDLYSTSLKRLQILIMKQAIYGLYSTFQIKAPKNILSQAKEKQYGNL